MNGLNNMQSWMPIDTCPKPEFDQANWYVSGPRYLLWIGYCTIGHYSYTQKGKGRWQNNFCNINPTHWMPLPDPPTN